MSVGHQNDATVQRKSMALFEVGHLTCATHKQGTVQHWPFNGQYGQRKSTPYSMQVRGPAVPPAPAKSASMTSILTSAEAPLRLESTTGKSWLFGTAGRRR